jgi:hypothetical protein
MAKAKLGEGEGAKLGSLHATKFHRTVECRNSAHYAECRSA